MVISHKLNRDQLLSWLPGELRRIHVEPLAVDTADLDAIQIEMGVPFPRHKCL